MCSSDLTSKGRDSSLAFPVVVVEAPLGKLTGLDQLLLAGEKTIDEFPHRATVLGHGTRSPAGKQIVLLCRSEERRVGKECRSRWSPYH